MSLGQVCKVKCQHWHLPQVWCKTNRRMRGVDNRINRRKLELHLSGVGPVRSRKLSGGEVERE